MSHIHTLSDSASPSKRLFDVTNSCLYLLYLFIGNRRSDCSNHQHHFIGNRRRPCRCSILLLLIFCTVSHWINFCSDLSNANSTVSTMHRGKIWQPWLRERTRWEYTIDIQPISTGPGGEHWQDSACSTGSQEDQNRSHNSIHYLYCNSWTISSRDSFGGIYKQFIWRWLGGEIFCSCGLLPHLQHRWLSRQVVSRNQSRTKDLLKVCTWTFHPENCVHTSDVIL